MSSKYSYYILILCFFCLVGVIALQPGGVTAMTPDGETPAEETVCDGETGASYGLCNAYCEAMDCDDNPNASGKACQNVRDNFMKKTGRDLPCESGGGPTPTTECPCAEEWRTLVSQYTGDPICGYVDSSEDGYYDSIILLRTDDWGEESAQIFAGFSYDENDTDSASCVSQVWDSDSYSYILVGGVELNNLYPTTTPAGYVQMQQAIFDACFQEMLDIAAEMGITCDDYN